MRYQAPVQQRSRLTERKLLLALDDLLRVHGYANTTIDDVAERANLTRATFLKRFGSKEQAVIVLFEKYCTQVYGLLSALQSQLDEFPSLHFTLREMSQQFESLLQMHMASNRAMHEHFLHNLEVHQLTKAIFKETVLLMEAVQARFLVGEDYSDKGAWAAAQLLVTIDYNYLLRAMPAFPDDHAERHKLIAELLAVAIRR